MGDEVILQVFVGMEGVFINVEVIFLGKVLSLKVSEALAGCFFNVYGNFIDGGLEVEGKEQEIGGLLVNFVWWKQFLEFIIIGIVGIDFNNILVIGQKIFFFVDFD